LTLPVTRDNNNNNRAYTEYDLKWVYFAKIIRKAGVSVEALAQYVALFKQYREESMVARQEILLQQKQALQQKIADLNEALDYLSHKMENNGKHLTQFEKTLDPDENSDLG
jgi:DNA-binding transcriptional MerR regulator